MEKSVDNTTTYKFLSVGTDFDDVNWFGMAKQGKFTIKLKEFSKSEHFRDGASDSPKEDWVALRLEIWKRSKST